VTTGGESITVHAITSSIDVYEPDLRATVYIEDLNGGVAEPGDVLGVHGSGQKFGVRRSDRSLHDQHAGHSNQFCRREAWYGILGHSPDG
jgi:hypothetical protein